MDTRDVGIVPTKSSRFECVSGQNVVEMENYILYAQSGKGEPMSDLIDRQAEIEALEKCYTCKHVYQRIDDADTLYCRCRKGCRYEEVKIRRSTGNSQ